MKKILPLITIAASALAFTQFAAAQDNAAEAPAAAKADKPTTVATEKTIADMWEAGGILSFANVSRNLLARCMILSIYLEEIQKLIVAAGWEDSREAIDNIIHFSLATSESTWVLRTVIFLQGTLYSDRRLVNFVTSQQAETWKKFTVAFIQFLSDDVDLLTAYGNLSTEVEWLPK